MLQWISGVASRASTGDWLLLLPGLFLLLYVAGTWNYDYFRRRGVPSTSPWIPFLGDVAPLLWQRRRAFADLVQEQYTACGRSSMTGSFMFTKPAYMVRDTKLLKLITVKHFDKFTNHQSFTTESDPIFANNLFGLKDQAWREMRATLSPAFTTSKMKGVFPLVSQCGEQMALHLRKTYADSAEGRKGEPLPTDMKDLFSRMANDVIATAVYGIACDSLREPDNSFYHMGKSLTTFKKLSIFIMLFPKLSELLGLRLLDVKATDFFDSLVRETISERKKKGIFRPDVLQLMMQAQEGSLTEEKEDAAEAEDIGTKKKLTDDDISAQAGTFFFAGFETVSVSLCLIAYVLSHHPEVQQRLQSEIKNELEESDGKTTYEAVQRMKYLDCVINETLRLHPPNMSTDRQCREDVALPAGTDTRAVVIEKGLVMTIPIIGLHRDPLYWEDPMTFDPERFSDANKHKIQPFTYMPFGVGPRICIGQRLALMEVKVALVHLLTHFDLHPCAKTKHPLEYEQGFNVRVRGGFWCGLTPRDA